MRRTLSLALAFALVLAAPMAFAQDGTPTTPPADAATVGPVGNVTLSHWIGVPSAVAENVSAGTSASLWFGVQGANATSPTVVFLNVTTSTPGVTIENGTLVIGREPNNGSFGRVTLVVAPDANGTAAYTFAGEVYQEDNGTLVLVGPLSGSGGVPIAGVLAPAPSPGLPSWVWIGLAVGLFGIVLAGVLIGRQRAQRRAMQGQKRSQVMREMELEQKLEKAKDPEQVQEIKQEIRQQEQVREKRRELQILEAKRADVMKTLDLLKKRHESGGLTKLQYDNMVAKKQGDLQKIEADIAQMEAEDAGGAAAS